MKKLLIILMVCCTLIQQNVFADDNVWRIVDKDFGNGIDYSLKVGDYFFKIEDEYDSEQVRHDRLLYSTDGIDFVRTDYETCQRPIYSHGLYFVFYITYEGLPESKRTRGFNNAPLYILDENLNLLKKFDDKYYMEYGGFYEGWHYISCKDYSDIIFDKGTNRWVGTRKDTIYKTTDGSNLILTDENEDLSFLRGETLYNNNILFSSYQKKVNSLKTTNGIFNILYEMNLESGYTYSRWNPVLVSFYNVIGERTYESHDGRIMNGSVTKDYLSMDGVYGVEMPDDIGSFVFELNDKLYFYKENDDCYYCIDESELKDKIMVVYKNNILAFETPPTIENDRTLVPMRFLFEQMGADVDWNNDTQTATVEKQGDTISFSINNTEAKVNNTVKTMDVPARLINDKTMIPLRFLSEELGYNVQWDGETRTVTITD